MALVLLFGCCCRSLLVRLLVWRLGSLKVLLLLSAVFAFVARFRASSQPMAAATGRLRLSGMLLALLLPLSSGKQKTVVSWASFAAAESGFLGGLGGCGKVLAARLAAAARSLGRGSFARPSL